MAEPGSELIAVTVLKVVWPAAVVFPASLDPVVDTAFEDAEVALEISELEGRADEPDGTVPVSVWTMVVKFSVKEMVDSVN